MLHTCTKHIITTVHGDTPVPSLISPYPQPRSRRSEPDAKEPTKLQRQSDPANHGPRVVEVSAVRDEEVRLAWVFWVTKSNDLCAGIVC
jgi:hypothetical protein